jgi:hypothetical protein
MTTLQLLLAFHVLLPVKWALKSKPELEAVAFYPERSAER